MGTVSCIATTRTFDRPLLVSGSGKILYSRSRAETECISEAEELVGDYATSMPPDRKLLQCTYTARSHGPAAIQLPAQSSWNVLPNRCSEGFRARVRGIPGSRQSCERTGAFGMDLFCG